MRKKTHEQYVLELHEKNPMVEVIGRYINSSTPILHHCIKHDILWNITPHNALEGKGCKQCKKEKFCKSMCKTHKEYVDELKIKLPHVIAIENYVDSSTRIMHYCIKHDVLWESTPDNVLHSTGCRLCRGEAIGNKLIKSHELYIDELYQVNPYIEVIESYIGANTPILHKCKVDGYIWLATPANILYGCGCPECKARMLSQMFRKSHDQYIKEVAAINFNIEVLGQYVNSHTPILHRCKLDGHTWKIAPSNVLNGQGCPCCQESKGERQIRQWLESNNIIYVYQKTFTDCKNKKELPFDFYLQEYNMCIEFDGLQHFEPVDFAGKGEIWAKKQFDKIQYNDEIKNQYCKKNNIHLLRIPYFKNIEEELNNFLFI